MSGWEAEKETLTFQQITESSMQAIQSAKS